VGESKQLSAQAIIFTAQKSPGLCHYKYKQPLIRLYKAHSSLQCNSAGGEFYNKVPTSFYCQRGKKVATRHLVNSNSFWWIFKIPAYSHGFMPHSLIVLNGVLRKKNNPEKRFLNGI
jgi:hypothetical protein